MRNALLLSAALATLSAPLNAQTCPAPGSSGRVEFPGGAIAMRTALAVNPDGAAASYTPGDHGYTYIANGVNLRLAGGGLLTCSADGNGGRCRRDWLRAESLGFAAGSPEFCVFAMEVEPISPGAALASCGQGRVIAGGGKGRPKLGAPFPAVGGGTVRPYLSTTSLRHRVGGQTLYVDSATVPALVAPTSRPDLVGAIAWVRFGTKDSFAIVGDTGPRFGEGSVALHQRLRSGSIGPAQPVGPIALALRCTAAETGLRPPFESRPDITGDRCRAGHAAQGGSDIRAYSGIDGRSVESVILAGVKLPMQGSTVTQEITPGALEQRAAAAGFDRARLAAMADCVAH
jgi:hypothetical protein